MEGLPQSDYTDPVYLRVKEILQARLSHHMNLLKHADSSSKTNKARGAVLELESLLKEPPATSHTAQQMHPRLRAGAGGVL